MAEYKKKKVTKKLPDTRVGRASAPEDIEMKSRTKGKRTASARPELTVVKGRKHEKRRSLMLIGFIIILLIAVYLIILAFHPVGVIEYFSSLYKTIGTGGGYDVPLGAQDISDCERKGDYYYLVTETDIKCINNNGKSISSVSHGFADPVCSTAETRYIVYGQGEKTVKAYSFDRELFARAFDEQIICTDICDSGVYAVATHANGYDSVVYVFDRNNKPLFEWYSSDGIVSSLRLTSDGKRLIVSAFTADQGQLNTYINVFDFSSADPEYRFTFQNEMIYRIYLLSNSRACAVSENSVHFLNIKDGTVSSQTADYSNYIAESIDGGLVIVSNLAANSERNSVTVYNRKGGIDTQISLELPVNDIAVRNGSFYILSDSALIRMNRDGEILSTAEISFDTEHIVPISERYVACVNNSQIIKTELISTEE